MATTLKIVSGQSWILAFLQKFKGPVKLECLPTGGGWSSQVEGLSFLLRRSISRYLFNPWIGDFCDPDLRNIWALQKVVFPVAP